MNETSVVPPAPNPPAPHPTFAEAFRFWLKLGFISFGGPTGQIAIMHTELVERKRWISEDRFLHALNYCMLLPGPEAQQLATYIGWLLHRTAGGIVAGSLFVLPSALLLWLLSVVYVTWGRVGWISAVFDGLKPAVLAIVVSAAWRIGSRALKNPPMWGIAIAAFIALFAFHLPFPAVIAAAALVGWAGHRRWPDRFAVLKGHGKTKPNAGSSVLHDDAPAADHTRPTLGRALRVTAICLLLWWLPVLALAFAFGTAHVLVKQGIFFSKAAMVTFGGAYAVLPYVSQQAVERFAWLGPGQMLDGLALAETTPGPLIMVLQFVGFLGAWKFHEPLSPLASATLGAFITTWTTFLPCFLWIFLGAPHIEQMRGRADLNAALSAITAAVVGVVFNLALWFGWHVLFPEDKPVNVYGIAVCAVALVGLIRWKWNIIAVVLASGALGVVIHLLR